MNGPMVDEELNEDPDLNHDLGLRPVSRVERRANQRRARTRRGFGCFAGLVSLLVVGGLIGGLAFGFGKGRDALEKVFSAPDYSGTGTTAVMVEITQGQSAQSIADTLEKKGVVKSARAFERAARDNAQSRSIQAATYTLKKEMSAKAALDLLLNPAKSVLVTRIGFPSGRTKAEITTILQKAKAAKLPAGAAAAAMAKPWSLGLPSYAKNNPEGFLYPGTYDVPNGSTAYSILKLMTTQFAKTSAEIKLPQVAQRKKVDPYQVVIIASIITAETNREEDYGKVARVIYNRLAAGQKLQMDSTIHYVVGRNGKVFTSNADREIDSLYNTYQHTGLPPTPINSPGRETLQAALNPTPGGWKYFTLINLDTGETAFASSSSEHLQNVKKLQAWCTAHAGRC